MRDDGEDAEGARGAETAEAAGAAPAGAGPAGTAEGAWTSAAAAAAGCATRSRLAVSSDSSTGIHPTLSVIGRARFAGPAPASLSRATLRGDRRAYSSSSRIGT